MNEKQSSRRSFIRTVVGAGFEAGAAVLGIDSYRNFTVGGNRAAEYDKKHPNTPSQQDYQTAVAALTPQAEMTIDANGHGVIIVPNAAQAQKEVKLYEDRQAAIKPHHDRAATEAGVALASLCIGGAVLFHKSDNAAKH